MPVWGLLVALVGSVEPLLAEVCRHLGVHEPGRERIHRLVVRATGGCPDEVG